MPKKVKKNILSVKNPLIMGILNVTPDSFYDGGKFSSIKNAISQAKKMVNEGVDIIDVGAFTSKPFSKEITISDEKKRLFPVLKELTKLFPNLTISVDTYRREIAEKSINIGASIINDIYAGEYDSSMIDFIVTNNITYVAMHMNGNPLNMQKKIMINNFKSNLLKFFINKTKKFNKAGFKKLIIDPGFGFGKSIEQNFKMINLIDDLKKINKYILVGLSRKSMIYKTLNSSPEESLNSTTILNTICVLKGVNILRVHDVKEAKEIIKMINLIKENK
tara:strand:+ start:12436 stop:13266 length:831 start_codon:yes stop_codon:yes gene_type:complete